MTELGRPDRTVAGILSWYSTIHRPPAELDRVLAEFHRMLVPGGKLVIGFFDSDDGVAAFDHKVITAYRWPVDEFAARLAAAGFHRARAPAAAVPGASGPQVRGHRGYFSVRSTSGVGWLMLAGAFHFCSSDVLHTETLTLLVPSPWKSLATPLFWSVGCRQLPM